MELYPIEICLVLLRQTQARFTITEEFQSLEEYIERSAS
ncbi:hypothetical protein LEP1GSC062_0551 [Leptospira alexanderi serovar Manhao 3 str. L 60]|uniref:Uncharacterized protein n=1 Tax=Leptospira alexanderi serovar Manhao 3 str. L 60 TaxID=1049759 RepID=V6I2B8_9LEPT|nr:hypothetical protein LEP1GSC062_0551 [Leptospira alexanderi serovar Manhao 3 str. L 60]